MLAFQRVLVDSNTMTSEEYIEQSPTVSVKQALAEIQNHGHKACYATQGTLFLCDDDDASMIEEIHIVNGRVSTQAIFDWLGY